MKFGVMRIWTQNWGWIDFLRRWIIKVDLWQSGHYTMCGRCYRYSPRWYCGCGDEDL